MFRSFTVKNFRCFRELTLAPLERINLIAGKNNSGKTALLEAIHLHSYPRNCELPFILNERRGTDEENKYDTNGCEWLFFDKNGASGLELRSENDKGETRTLQMWFVDPATAEVRFPELKANMQQDRFAAQYIAVCSWLILKSLSNGKEETSIVWPGRQGGSGVVNPSIGSNPAPRNGPSIFLGSAGRSAKEDALAFSQLELANQQEQILPPLCILEPRLQRLSILLLAEQPVIHGKLDGLSRQVPVQFMGEGIRRLLSILLAIHEARGGNVLIDEIENGLHYSVLKDVWRAIAEAARRADVQVFATTHSWECILHAHEAFAEDTIYDLRLHRIDRFDDRESTVSYTREMIETALYSGLEMR